MKTKCFGVRLPEDFARDLEKAKAIIGATSYSDLLRDALRHYLSSLSILSERSARIKGEKHD
jgi:metal-responsive CopG/Arc/MetJ family transcriptional regulator